uniref:Transmembrane protein n=1 Tax=Mesocestoides corti TaxID=53468 RepID=A0A5K3ERQ6_MESCO
MQNTLVRHPDLATKLASSGLLSTRLTGSTLLAVQPPTLGGIGQLPQTKQQEGAVANLKTAIIQHSSGVKTTFNDAATAGIRLRPPSFEIVNFFLALAFLAIRIAATFWTVWPTFSYLSSVLLIFTGVYLTFDSLIIVRLPMQLTPWQTILSTSIAFFITLGSFGVLFHLAIRQFNKVLRENYYTVANMLGMAERQTNGASEALVTSPPWSETNSLERKEGSTKCHRSPLRGRPLIVLGFLSLVATTLVRMPCLYDMFQLYWSEKDYLCLTTIVLFVCVHMAWLMMWFGFAMKQKWTFHVKYSPAMQQSQLSNQESSFRNTYLSEPAVPGPIKFPQMQEFNDEAPFELSCPNSTYVYFSPLQLQNPGVPAQEPTLLPSVTNGFKQPLRVPPPPESSASQVMTNVLYAPAASNQKAATSENEPFLLRGPFLLTPPSLKYASIRRSKLWDAETNGKQEVVVDVAETAPPTRITRSPRTISSETAVDNEIRPQSVPPLSIGEVDNNLLKVAPIAVQESGHSTTSSGDRICSQV